MPFTLLIVGVVLLTAGVHANAHQLFTLVGSEFKSKTVNGQTQDGFLPWIGSILLLGSLGYIDELRTFSRLFLTLVVIVLLVHNKGFFAQLKLGIPELFGMPSPQQSAQANAPYAAASGGVLNPATGQVLGAI